MSVHTAISGPLKEMQEGRLGIGCRPNADTYNAITQVNFRRPTQSLLHITHLFSRAERVWCATAGLHHCHAAGRWLWGVSGV